MSSAPRAHAHAVASSHTARATSGSVGKAAPPVVPFAAEAVPGTNNPNMTAHDDSLISGTKLFSSSAYEVS